MEEELTANEISQLVVQIVDQFAGCATGRDKSGETVRIKECLAKSVSECLHKCLDPQTYVAGVFKGSHAVKRCIELNVSQMKYTEHHDLAKSLLCCLENLSDDNNGISVNCQNVLRFLFAVSEIRKTESLGSEDSFLDSNKSKPLCPEAAWYNKSENQDGILRMFPSEVFELKDDFCSKLKLDICSEFSTCHNGLSLIDDDLQQMMNGSRSVGFEQSMSRSYNRCDSGVGQGPFEFSVPQNTLSDDEGYLELCSSSFLTFDQSTISNDTSLSFFDDFENRDQEFGRGLNEKSFEYQDSLFHLDSSCDLFVEQQSHTPNVLVCTPDILHLLVGLSSDSCSIVKSGRFLNVFFKGEEESNSNKSILRNFAVICSYYIRLRDFLRVWSPNKNGAVQNALKCGISEYLLCYELTVSNTHMKEQDFVSVLSYQFDDVGENLRYVAKLCGINDTNSEQTEIPSGIDLIDYLYTTAAIAGPGHMYSTLMFLIKHAFSPYFGFLRQWLFEGICDYSLEEFRLQKDPRFLNSNDETYWTCCYTAVEGVEQFTPSFLKEIAMDILICGKSFNILKRCCPNHLLFSIDLVSPNFELGFLESTIRNVQKKGTLAMLNRINCMLEKVEKKKQDFVNKIINLRELQYAGVGERLHLSLVQFKSQIEETMRRISAEEKCSNSEIQTIEREPPSNKKELNSEQRLETSPCELDSTKENFGSADYSANDIAATTFSSLSSLTFDRNGTGACSNSKNEIDIFVDNPSNGKALDRLIGQLMKRLLGHYNESELNLRLFQRQSIHTVVKLSLYPLMRTQIDVVNKCVLNYFFDVLGIHDHFLALTDFFCLRDGEFGDSLCQGIFELTTSSHIKTPACKILNGARLNSVLMAALANSLKGETTNAAFLSLQTGILPDFLPTHILDVMKLLQLKYQVEWPCNVVITMPQISVYNQVLVVMLGIQHVLITLKDMWFYFKKLRAQGNVSYSPQFRMLHIYRHDMQHFIKAIKCYIGSELLDVAWHEFQTAILKRVKNLEDLRSAHSTYVSTITEVCLLNAKYQKRPEEKHNLQKVLKCVLKFHSILTNSTWEFNCLNHHWEHTAFDDLQNEFERYRKNATFFYKDAEESMQPANENCLEPVLLMRMGHLSQTIDFNYYYKKLCKKKTLV